MDFKRNQLETRIATLELMVVTERARPSPNEDTLAELEKELSEARLALENYKE